MKFVQILVSSLLLIGLTSPALMANNTATPGVTQTMLSSGSPDLATAKEASQKAIKLMSQKNYYAQQYQVLSEIIKTVGKAPSSTCFQNFATKAKTSISNQWKSTDAEFLKLLNACGYDNPKAMGKYGEASLACSQQYIVPFNHAPITVCSRLADAPNPNDASCLTVDGKYPAVTTGTTDYVTQAKTCH